MLSAMRDRGVSGLQAPMGGLRVGARNFQCRVAGGGRGLPCLGGREGAFLESLAEAGPGHSRGLGEPQPQGSLWLGHLPPGAYLRLGVHSRASRHCAGGGASR